MHFPYSWKVPSLQPDYLYHIGAAFLCLLTASISNSILLNLTALAQEHQTVFSTHTFNNQPSAQPNSLLSTDTDRNPKEHEGQAVTGAFRALCA